jgi:type VI secretion system secreted protein VgrG
VYWGVFASSTLGSNVEFQGSVLAGASNSVGTDSTVVGRLLCTTGAITLLSNTITLP